jgi:WD40 repeat protein
VRSVVLSGDGRLVASRGLDGTVQLWEAEGGLPPVGLPGHAGAVWGVALGGGGSIVASGDDWTVRLWDARSGALRGAPRGERRCEALDITGLTGITAAQRRTLLTLRAIERGRTTTPAG